MRGIVSWSGSCRFECANTSAMPATTLSTESAWVCLLGRNTYTHYNQTCVVATCTVAGAHRGWSAGCLSVVIQPSVPKTFRCAHVYGRSESRLCVLFAQELVHLCCVIDSTKFHQTATQLTKST